MNIDQIKALLKKYHLKPNFTYGQNFLIDDAVLTNIIKAADVSKTDCVLEIGPGIGNLTEKLLQKAGLVLSIEKDPKFLPILKDLKKRYKNFHFEIADILEYDFQKILKSYAQKEQSVNDFRIHSKTVDTLERGEATTLSGLIGREKPNEGLSHQSSYKVVANIPYYITGKILQMLTTAKFKPQSVTLLTQKEVAQNIVAKAGELSVLAISVQLYGNPKIIQNIKASSFFPVPKVDSTILHIELDQEPRFQIQNEKKFFQVVKACFAGKRKQIHNTLVHNLGLEKNHVLQVLNELQIHPATRPQELGIKKWIELSEKIFK